MPRPPKRPRPTEVIDLTDDEPTPRPAKSPRYPSSPYSSQPSAPTFSSQLSVPPSSPAAFSSRPTVAWSSSQRSLANDALEPSTQELTQSDDGPQHEFYGSFGKIPSFLASKVRLLTRVQTARL